MPECMTVDLSNPKNISESLPILVKRYGVDILINNSGVAGPVGQLHEVDIYKLIEAYQVNSFGALQCMQAVIPYMRENGGGNIINISSWSTDFHYPDRGAYTGSKSSLEHFSKYVAAENAEYNILCNVVAPSLIEGDRFKEVVKIMAEKQGKPEAVLEKAFRGKYKLKRLPTNEHIASKVLSLLTEPHNQFVTGQTIYVSAGFKK